MSIHQMEKAIQAHSLNTKLRDRTVWFDGTSSYDPSNLLDIIQTTNVQYVDYLTNDIIEYNKRQPKSEQIKVKTECPLPPLDWTIPKQYQNLDVVQFLALAHTELTKHLPQDEIQLREIRLAKELTMYSKRQLFDVLRATIFVINTLTTHNVVWGVGRGSSVSSYVLYVIGVHDVDSFAYDLDIGDFLHD